MIRFRTICSVAVMGSIALWSGMAVAADASAKDEVAKAAKALDEKGNYSWKTTTSSASQSRFRPGPVEGKTEKGGFSQLTMTIADNPVEAVLKGGKGAVKTQDGWRSLTELSEGDNQKGGRFFAGVLQNMKTPAAQAADLAAKVKEIKKTDDAYTGDLTEDGAKELLSFGRRPNSDAPGAKDAAGSVKFWIKDGALSKYEYTVKGTIRFNDNDVNVDRTTTVEIKDVDSTKINVPEEAKSKAS